MSNYLPNGIGESLGDQLVTNDPLFITDDVRYVSSENGVDSAAYGSTKAKPYATLVYAFAQAAAGDIIVLLDGHEETLATQLDIDLAVTIVGSGQTDGKPTVKLTGPGDNGSVLLFSVAGVEIRNVWFEEHPSAASTSHISVTATGCRIIGCYFESNENNNAHCVAIANSLITTINDCTFISNATTVADRPNGGVSAGSSGTLFFDNNVFDANEFGFESHAFTANLSTTIRGFNNSFLNGAEFSAGEASAHIVLSGGTYTGDVRLLEN